MQATPMICPNCGELLIARVCQQGRALLVPWHEDAIAPGAICAISRRLIKDGVLL